MVGAVQPSHVVIQIFELDLRTYPFELKINSTDAQGILTNSVPMDQSQRLSPVQLPQFYSPEES